MSLLKKLQIGDNAAGRYTKEYLLVDYKCHTCRSHNAFRPNADMSCESIELTIIAPGVDDMSIYDWFINQTSVDGRIQVELPSVLYQGNTEYKEILFEGATCFSLEEHYEIDKNQRRVLHLGMIAGQVTIDGVVYNRK
jgi:hypothetical protein